MTGSPSKGFKVVDRRHWVGPTDEPAATGGGASAAREDAVDAPRDPTAEGPEYVLRLERAVAARDERIRVLAERHEAATRDVDAARERVRRESERDRERWRRELIGRFLDVADDIDRALDAAADRRGADPFYEGVVLVREGLVHRLSELGVARLKAVGEVFDPERHDAIAAVPVDDPDAEGRVVGVIQAGYTIGGEILRPAAVAVGTAPDPDNRPPRSTT